MRILELQSRGLLRLIYFAVLLALPSLGWADLPRAERTLVNAIFELTNGPEMLGGSHAGEDNLADLKRLRVAALNGDATAQYHLAQTYDWRDGPYYDAREAFKW